MRRRIVMLIGLCFILSISLVLVLSSLSHDLRRRPGNFLREFPPFVARERQALDLRYNSYYIAGATDSNIYFGNISAPLHLIAANSTLTDTQHVELKIVRDPELKVSYGNVKIEGNNFFLTDGSSAVLYKGRVNEWTASRHPWDSIHFLDFLPLSNATFLIRTLEGEPPQNVLERVSDASPMITTGREILQKQVDGIFCTDGMMHYDGLHGRIVYLYRYRNEYIEVDTNLQIISRHHTIDTTSKAKIEVRTTASKSGLTTSELITPRRVVNKRSCVWNGFLFVQSMIPANNEAPEVNDYASVIDTYDVLTGKYRLSFYIYHYHATEKLRDFRIFDDKLYALFDRHVQVLDLDTKYFKR